MEAGSTAYEAGLSDRRFRHGSRPTVGLLTDFFANQVLGPLWRTAVRTAADCDVNLLTFCGYSYRSYYKSFTSHIFEMVRTRKLVDGLLVMPPAEGSEEAFCGFLEGFAGLPIVCAGPPAMEGPLFGLADVRGGVEEAVAHLIRVHGRKRFALFSAIREEVEAFREACSTLGAETRAEWTILSKDALEADADSIFSKSKNRPDAVLAGSGRPARLWTAMLHGRGIRVPEDVSVIALDEISTHAYHDPALTAVDYGRRETVEQAMRMLVGHLRFGAPLNGFLTPARLILRESCGCAGTSAFPTEARSAGKSLIEFLREGAKRDCEELLAEPGGWRDVSRLVDTLGESIARGAPEVFLEALRNHIRTVAHQRKADSFVNVVLSRMSDRISADTAGQDWEKVKRTVETGRRVALTLECRLQVRSRLLRRENIQQLENWLGALVADPRDRVASLGRIAKLCREFGTNGRVLLATYSGGGPYPTPEARIVFASRGQESMDVGPDGMQIDIEDMPPSRFYPDAERFSVLLQPLGISDATGFSIIDQNSEDWAVYDRANRYLSPIVLHIILLGVAGRQAEMLAKDNEELQRLNRELQDALAELRQHQEEMIHSERLRALGEMASGIAHDFNNNLTPILGYSELLLVDPDQLSDRKTALQYIQSIHTAARDAAVITKRLREFYRPRERSDAVDPIDINAAAEHAVATAQPRWKDQALAQGRSIAVRTDLGEATQVLGSEPELRHALVNLIFNSVDAINRTGTIVLRTRRDRHHAIIEVEDDGRGMPDDVRRRCMEPFFSTKGDRGSGLGLSLVFGIVRRHGGSISISSKVGKGTCVRILLPLPDSSLPLPSQAVGIPGRGTGYKILVVDDDPAVLRLISSYLKGRHTVTALASGREAIERMREDRFDLVITDLGMPDVQGNEVAVAAKSRQPPLPVILLTGFGEVMDVTQPVPKEVDRVVSKPVGMKDFLDAIAKVMTDAGDGTSRP